MKFGENRVEVLLGCSAGGDIQVLLPSSALMSPSESRAGAGPGRVRLFGPQALVKRPVVLSQPYCQVSAPGGGGHLGGQRSPGGGSGLTCPVSPVGPAPRAAPTAWPSSERSPPSAASPPHHHPHQRHPPKKTQKTPKIPSKTRKNPSKTPQKIPKKSGTPQKIPGPPQKNPGPPQKNPGPPQKPNPDSGGPILGGVVLALSGFQNPLRGHLRAAATAMGAEYRPDWTPECTHLVYLLDGSASSDSEGEEPEEAPPPSCPSPKVEKGPGPPQTDKPETPPPAAPATPPESADSEDQSEDGRGQRSNGRVLEVGVSPLRWACPPRSSTDPFGGSTEENSEDDDDDDDEEDFFEDKKFFLHGEFPEGEGRRLRRLVVAFGGSLAPYMDESVTHVVTSQDWDPAFEEALELRPSLVFVRPHWLLLCGERQRPIPAQPYLVTSSARQ
uniref:Uncharacterized protein n=1 Tax=Geospiza parvula TaxID=87175 RepID=A0A8U8BZT5_GEOPR